MSRRVITVLALGSLLLASCGAKRHPMPTTPQGTACVSYCGESAPSCKGGCPWWIAIFWPITFMCQGDCDEKYKLCEQACPDMLYPQVSTAR